MEEVAEVAAVDELAVCQDALERRALDLDRAVAHAA